MAVVVEVPDQETSRLARRLIGRRSGVQVVVAGESNGSRPKRRGDSEPPRRILVQQHEPRSAADYLGMLSDGVWAVLPVAKAEIDARLRDCVDRVRAGSSPLFSELAGDREEVGKFLAALGAGLGDAAGGFSESGRESPLSDRETQILQRISHGATSREIAAEMGFQLQTVKNKVTTILTKTHASSRTHAVAIALSRGWIRAV